MFFVEDDQPEVGHGSEDGAAGTDDDLDLAVGDALPFPVAVCVAEVAVEHGHVFKSAAETADGLGGEADFGDEDDGLATEMDDLLDHLDVDLGFSTSGDAVDEDGFVATVVEGVEDCVEGLLLVGVEGEVFLAFDDGFGAAVLADSSSSFGDEALVTKGLDGGLGALGGAGQLHGGERFLGGGECLHHCCLLWRQAQFFPLGGCFGGDAEEGGDPGAGLAADAGGDDGFEDLAQVAEVVLSDPLG